MVAGIVRSIFSKHLGPVIGNFCEMRISAAPEISDQFRERVGEIFVIADAETIALHNDVASKTARVVIKRGELRAFCWRQNWSCNRVAALRKRLLSVAPIQRLDSFAYGRCDGALFCCLTHAASAIRNASHKKKKFRPRLTLESICSSPSNFSLIAIQNARALADSSVLQLRA